MTGSINTNAPGRFWAIGEDNWLQTSRAVGTSDTSVVLDARTRTVLLHHIQDAGGTVFVNVEAAATTSSFPLVPGQTFELPVQYKDAAGLSIHFISDVAGQTVRVWEVFA